MLVKIVSLKEKIFEGEVFSAKLPSFRGEIEILDNHAHIFVLLDKGKIKLKTKSQPRIIEVSSGIAEFFENKLLILLKNESKE